MAGQYIIQIGIISILHASRLLEPVFKLIHLNDEKSLIIGFCILLRVILTVNCREYRSYLIKYYINCCETEGIIFTDEKTV
jgi:hypothetical protein